MPNPTPPPGGQRRREESCIKYKQAQLTFPRLLSTSQSVGLNPVGGRVAPQTSFISDIYIVIHKSTKFIV